jgi:hypothetical protein
VRFLAALDSRMARHFAGLFVVAQQESAMVAAVAALGLAGGEAQQQCCSFD